MPKQTHLVTMIFFMLLLCSGNAFATKPIQTTQRIIVLDPGHGGSSNGLTSSTGIEEKAITLKLARKTAQKLENRYNVFLTRTSDINASPQDRMAIANQQKAAFFLSFHLHHSPTPAAFFYYFDTPNAPSLKKATKATWISSAFLHSAENKKATKYFSQIFLRQETNITTQTRAMPIIVLEGATMPAILIEPFSISDLPNHPARIEILLDKYAQLIVDCIDQYFDKK